MCQAAAEAEPADHSMLDARAMLGEVFTAAVTGMVLVGLDGRVRDANPAFCRLVGRTLDDLVGSRTAELTHPDDRAESESALAELASGRTGGHQVHKRYLLPDGSVVYALRSSTVLRSAGGAPIAILTQVMDVTEGHLAQVALARSEERLRAILARASELTVLLDAQGRIIYASPASTGILGRAPEELAGEEALRFLHPDEQRRAAGELERHYGAPGVQRRHEYRILHSDASWRLAELSVTNLLHEPDVAAVVVNIRDVTDERAYQDRLARSEARLASLVGNSWDVVTVHDASGAYIYASPAVERQLGYCPEGLIGADPSQFLHPDDLGSVGAAWNAAVDDPTTDRMFVYRARHADGTWRWLESIATNRMADPAIAGMVVTSRDVTGDRRREAQQQAVTALSAEALRGGDVGSLFDRACTTAARMLEVPCVAVVEAVELGMLRVTHRYGPAIVDGPFPVASPAVALGPASMAARQGRSVIWNATEAELAALPHLERAGLRSAVAVPVTDGHQTSGALVAYAKRPNALGADDVSFLEATANVLATAAARRRAEQELVRRARYDELTGMPNRLAILERITHALRHLERRPSSVAVLFVDTDDFKLVNDSLGHAAGDRVITAVAERLSTAVRRSDTVARFGGDEFVVLCEDTDAATAEDIAGRLRQALGRPIDLGERQISVTASIGIAVTCDGLVSADDLLAEADTAMYAAKREGKNRAVSFDTRMRRKAREDLEASSALRTALAAEELELHYQPLVDVSRGAVCGWEALLRWHHPVEGMLGPDRFIDYAESSGLILPIGEWVLATAARQARAWRQDGCAGRVAVNVSARQLADTGFLHTVERALDQAGADPSVLTVELTESAVMDDLDRASKALQALRDLGLHVAMDDFGTGHSSLSYLANLPLDFVKIDRSFVGHAEADRRGSALLKAITGLCATLGIPAIAEGVETVTQLRELRRLRVPFAQGFLFGRPAPAAELDRRRVAGLPD